MYSSCVLKVINILGITTIFEKEKNKCFLFYFIFKFVSFNVGVFIYFYTFIYVFRGLPKVIFLRLPNILCLVKIRPACTSIVYLVF